MDPTHPIIDPSSNPATCATHRMPRAGVDVIDRPEPALLMVAATMQRPPRHETIVVLLDDLRRGSAVAVVSGTDSPDDVIGVVECFSRSEIAPRIGALIVASVRPGGECRADDIDRWLEMSDVADEAGIELLEWFVVGDTIECPRDLLGEPPRW